MNSGGDVARWIVAVHGSSIESMALLPQESILEIQGAAIKARLHRDALLQGIDRTFVAGLQRAPNDADQLLMDLDEMNQVERLADGTVPLYLWLQTAATRAQSRRESATFRGAMVVLGAQDPTLKPAPPSRLGDRATPRYQDEASRELSQALEEALLRKQDLQARGESTAEVQSTITALRRRLREGGQLRAGDSLGDGRYLLLEKISKGGFAVVWKALDRSSGALVAVKVLLGSHVDDASRRERFFRGAREMAKLSHDAVVRVLEPEGQEDGHFYYFVMELVEGGDLRQAVLTGRLDPGTAIAVILRVGDALAHAHARGVIHRDVKPANILLDAQGAPRLTDFDLVVAPDTTGGTATGAMGTFIYAAPEQLNRPQDVDVRADVYSLGMTALFCLRGADLPVEAMRDAGALVDQLTCRNELKAVLHRAVAWDKAKRIESVAAFCAALEAASAPRKRAGARWLWLLAAAVPTALGAAYTTGILTPLLARYRAHTPEHPVVPAHELKTSNEVVPANIGTTAVGSATAAAPAPSTPASSTLMSPPSASSAPVAPLPRLTCPEGMKLVPGGRFQMGAAQGMGNGDDAQTQDPEEVTDFCMDTKEVTVAEYISHRQKAKLGPWDLGDVQLCNWNTPGNSGVTHPLNCATWQEANDYCASSKKRLPSEKEWEYAARYPDQRIYPWGNNDPTSRLRLANVCDEQCKTMHDRLAGGHGLRKPMKEGLSDSWETTAPVGEFPAGASRLGLLDMAGNVAEWTSSAYCDAYSEKKKCFRGERVYRGGSWDSGDISLVTTTRRYHARERGRYNFIGFRCAADVTPGAP